jgi:DNA-binding NtrC family response regulator
MTARRRILVVDDDPMVLLVFQDTLRTLGDQYEIVTTQSGRQALDEIKARPFALVITDLTMPDLDGVALSEAINQTRPDTVVIWITAYGCRSVFSEAARLAIYRCYEKPLEVDEILGIAREALGIDQSAIPSEQNLTLF